MNCEYFKPGFKVNNLFIIEVRIKKDLKLEYLLSTSMDEKCISTLTHDEIKQLINKN